MYVVHHGEQPRAEIGPAAVEVQLRPRTLQRVLHQVVGGGAVADQRASVAPQPRDQLNQALGFVHRGNKAPRPRLFHASVFHSISPVQAMAEPSAEKRSSRSDPPG